MSKTKKLLSTEHTELINSSINISNNNKTMATPVNSTSSVKLTPSELFSILRSSYCDDGYDVLITYILLYFIQLVASAYRKFFEEDENVTRVVSIGLNYESRQLVSFNSDCVPINTSHDKENYGLPEFDEAVEKIAGDYDEVDIYGMVLDFIHGAGMDAESMKARESVINYFQDYLANAWGMNGVTLDFQCGHYVIEVTRNTSKV